jgi:hypothetical protein
MKHWRYRVPDSIKPNQLVTLQIATAQGVQETTGGIAGFKPGEIILIAIIPSVDGEQLAWSMTGMSASTNSHFPNNPLKGTSITLWKDVDEVGADGVLLKAVKSGSASWSATNPTEITLRVAVGDSP